MIYANEIDPKTCHWLKRLPIHIDRVDGRSIADVRGRDLEGFDECHFFAGIGGWPLALKLARWPTGFPVWTGSCPCQPFSAAGPRKGAADKANALWPEFRRLIAERMPAVVFGEQVASKDGRLWFAGVRDDLETLGYAVGAVNLCAAGVGAPHIRQRIYWVADAGGMVDAIGTGRPKRSRKRSLLPEAGREGARQAAELSSHWSDAEWIACRDGRTRPAKSGVRLLVDGLPGRVDQLRGLGNAIVPQVAAEFVSAFLETLEDKRR